MFKRFIIHNGNFFRISRFLLHFDEQKIRLQESNIERETLTANFLQDAHKLIKNTILAVN